MMHDGGVGTSNLDSINNEKEAEFWLVSTLLSTTTTTKSETGETTINHHYGNNPLVDCCILLVFLIVSSLLNDLDNSCCRPRHRCFLCCSLV
jgi:hypothetical protein